MLATAANASNAILKITDARLYVPDVTLSTEIAKQLSEEFKRSVYWVIGSKVVEITNANTKKNIRELLDSSYQGVKRLFVLAYNNTEGNNQVSVDSFKKYFLPSVEIETYNIEID